jgi:hypothetical protein
METFLQAWFRDARPSRRRRLPIWNSRLVTGEGARLFSRRRVDDSELTLDAAGYHAYEYGPAGDRPSERNS